MKNKIPQSRNSSKIK